MRKYITLCLMLAVFLIVTIAEADETTAPLTQEAVVPKSVGPIEHECTPATCPYWPEEIYEFRKKEQERRRNQAQRDRLNYVMRIEGRDFSPQKYQHYKNLRGAGIALLFFGVLSGAPAAALLGTAFLESLGHDEEAYGYDPYKRSRSLRAGGFALLSVCLLQISIGIPLIVLGQKGANRQQLLRRKHKIIDPPSL